MDDTIKANRFWLRQFASSFEVIGLPADIADGNGNRAHLCRNVSGTVQAVIRRLTNGDHQSMFAFFTGSLRIIVRRYFGLSRIFILTPPLRDVRQEKAENVLYLRSDVSDSQTLRQVLNTENEQLHAAFLAQDYDMDKVGIRARLNYQTDIDEIDGLGFLWDAIQDENQKIRGLPFRIRLSGSMEEDWSLSLESDQAGSGTFWAQFLESWIYMLTEHVHERMDTLVLSIPILPPAMEEKMRHEQSGRAVLQPAPALDVIGRFLDNVALGPANTAVVRNQDQLTYAELETLSNRMTAWLIAKDIKKGDVVALMMPSCFELVAAQLAILKAGAAFLPIDPLTPVQRVDSMMKSAAVKAILVMEDLSLSPDGMVLKVNREVVESYADRPIRVGGAPEDAALVIFTSGSTGTPKGVVLTRRNLAAQLDWLGRYFQMDERVVIPQKSTIGIIDSIFEILHPISYGRSAVYLRPYENIIYDLPDAQIAWFSQIGATWLIFVPPLLNLLYPLLDKVPTLKQVCVSGDMMLRNYKGSYKVYNAYGLSECSGIDTIYPVPPAAESSFPIGRPIDNTYVYVLDEAGNPAPPFVKGEIVIGGECVGDYYLNDLALTEMRFISDPYDPSRRLYRTGDIGWWLPDGLLMYVGRRDRQVKIRGMRVDLNEVEAVLMESGLVAQAAVISKEDGNGNQLMAFVVPAAGSRSDPGTLRTYTQSRLHQQAVPSKIIVLKDLPLTATGKADRRMLLQMDADGEKGGKPIAAPENNIQQTLVTVWQEALGNTEIGIDDDFFEMGGHSLNISIAVMRANERLKSSLKADDILNNPTIRQLSLLWNIAASDGLQGDDHTARIKEGLIKLNERVPGKRHLVILHPFAGFSYGYRNLADHLNGKVNVYGINAIGLFDASRPLANSFEEVASDYIQMIRSADIRDRLIICGYSASVPLAFEIAKQMEYQKLPVDGVILVDDFFKANTVQLSEERLNRLKIGELVWGLKNYLGVELDSVEYSEDWLDHRLDSMGEEHKLIAGFKLSEIKHCKEVILNLFRCQMQYSPSGKIAADVTYMYSDQYGADHNWKSYVAGNYECVRVEGMHSTIFQEPAASMNSEVFLQVVVRDAASQKTLA